MFSLDHCPVCQQGLCGIRICGLETGQVHGLIVCDECEAIWVVPDLKSSHQYPDSMDARCPTCHEPLWSPASRWADWEDVRRLGWQSRIDPGLTWDDHRTVDELKPWDEPNPKWSRPLEPPDSDRTELA